MGDDDEDLRLLDRWCGGDAEAGNQLFQRHYPAVYRFFERKVGRDVQEPVQETFLVCVRKRDQFRRESKFTTFLFAVARLVLHEYWRRLRKQEAPVDFNELSIASLSTSAGTRLARAEDRGRLLEALQELPVDQQLLLELYYWERLDGASLAAVFDVEPATIRGRLFRARAALRELVRGSEVRGTTTSETADFEVWARELQEAMESAGQCSAASLSAMGGQPPGAVQNVRNERGDDDAIKS
jgi:RNA polymerase sigma factor (sigma-70 family)